MWFLLEQVVFICFFIRVGEFKFKLGNYMDIFSMSEVNEFLQWVVFFEFGVNVYVKGFFYNCIGVEGVVLVLGDGINGVEVQVGVVFYCGFQFGFGKEGVIVYVGQLYVVGGVGSGFCCFLSFGVGISGQC